MKEYIFGCILISLIAGIALRLCHLSLREPTKIAVGIATLLFVSSPFLYLLDGAFRIELPSLEFSEVWGEGRFDEVGKEAYVRGVKLALAEKYGADTDSFAVTVDGFDTETLSAERLTVTLTGKAALLDYRAVCEYLENSLKIGECRVNVDIG